MTIHIRGGGGGAPVALVSPPTNQPGEPSLVVATPRLLSLIPARFRSTVAPLRVSTNFRVKTDGTQENPVIKMCTFVQRLEALNLNFEQIPTTSKF